MDGSVRKQKLNRNTTQITETMNAAVINQCQQVEVALVKVILVRHVGFMRHFKKICGPHKHQICEGNMQKYGIGLLETNYPISFHRGPDTWMMPFCWQPDGRCKET